MNESISEMLQSVNVSKVLLMLSSIVITQSLPAKRSFKERFFPQEDANPSVIFTLFDATGHSARGRCYI